MELTVEQQDGYVMATTAGPIDETASDHFRENVHPLIGQGNIKLVVDLSGSPRINSSGIAGLVRLVTDANTNGGKVILAAPTSFVMNVFEVSKLNRFFDIADSVADAAGRFD